MAADCQARCRSCFLLPSKGERPLRRNHGLNYWQKLVLNENCGKQTDNLRSRQHKLLRRGEAGECCLHVLTRAKLDIPGGFAEIALQK